MRIRKAILGAFLFQQFLIQVLYIALDDCKDLLVFSSSQYVIIIVTEVLFLLDMILSALTVPETLKKPSLSATALPYLKNLFLIDFLSTVVSNATFLISMEVFLTWGVRLKLLRIFRVKYIHIAYKAIIDVIAAPQPKSGKVILFIITTCGEAVFWLHVLTCFWIKLGSWDCKEDRWRDMSPHESSWMFIPETDFNGASDRRTIYE